MKFFIFLSYSNISVANSISSTETKQRILQEFKNKLLNEEEIQKELKKNKILTNEDFDSLIEKDNDLTFKDLVNSVKPTEEEIKIKKQEQEEKKRKKEEEKKRIAEEERRLKEEEERLKEEERKLKEEEKDKQRQITEEEKRKRKEEKERIKKEKELLKERQKKLIESKNQLSNSDINETETININDISIDDNTVTINYNNYSDIDKIKDGLSEKIYNITDTGVSEEFLYTKEYQELINNKTNISKVDINKDSDIPVIYAEEKNLINFDTSDIPEELLTYKRSTENKHIPSIISIENIQDIAIKAIENNNLPMLRGVIEQTKDPDFLVSKNKTLLNFAIEHDKYILARYLIYSGASINKLDSDLNNPLHISIINHSDDIIDLLINNGVDINAQNINGDTPLLLSITTSQDNVIVKLLKNGADLKIKNKNGDDALSLSIKNNKRKIQQYLRNIIRQEELNK